MNILDQTGRQSVVILREGQQYWMIQSNIDGALVDFNRNWQLRHAWSTILGMFFIFVQIKLQKEDRDRERYCIHE